jgi:hypothetical protein
MDHKVLAKVKVYNKSESNDGQQTVYVQADYADDRNKEWAKYTPALSLSLSVIDSVADHFEVGATYDLLLTKTSE